MTDAVNVPSDDRAEIAALVADYGGNAAYDAWKRIEVALEAAPKAETVSDPYKLDPWEEGREEGRLADRAWRIGDSKPAVGRMVLISGVHGDIESDQHRAYLWRRVVGYGVDGVDFICLQTKGCWPTVERLDNCWFAASPHQPLSNTQQLPEAPKVEQEPLGKWMSAALDDQSVCQEMKRDIRDWFARGCPPHPAPSSDELLEALEPFAAIASVMEARDRMALGKVRSDDEIIAEIYWEGGQGVLVMGHLRDALSLVPKPKGWGGRYCPITSRIAKHKGPQS